MWFLWHFTFVSFGDENRDVWNFDTRHFETDDNSGGQVIQYFILYINSHIKNPKDAWVYPCRSLVQPPAPTVQQPLMYSRSSVCEVFPGSDELFQSVSFCFFWPILVLLSWSLRFRIKIRYVDINTTTYSKHCGEGYLWEGYSSSKHDFF